MMKKIILLSFIIILSSATFAEDWPTYRHDNKRSSVTADAIKLPLNQKWVFKSKTPPNSAWSDPARWDAFKQIKKLPALRNIDPAYYTVSVGNSVYFGSSSDFSVKCLDINTGKEKWSYYTQGSVRIAPTVANGKVYFGSDDGYAYCINAKTGKLIWKFNPKPANPLIASNGKFISEFPCRTGVMIRDGIAYCAFSLFAWPPYWICALDANTGKKEGAGTFVTKLGGNTLQGAMLTEGTKLIVPAGRSAIDIFDLKTSKYSHSPQKSGGVDALLTIDNCLISRDGTQKGLFFLYIFDLEKPSKERKGHATHRRGFQKIISTNEGVYAIKSNSLFFIPIKNYATNTHKITDKAREKDALKKDKKKDNKAKIAKLEKDIKADDTKNNKTKWSTRIPQSFELIKSKNLLFVGCKNKVIVINANTGNILTNIKVNGNAYGLTVANGHLLISTDKGFIYCFKH